MCGRTPQNNQKKITKKKQKKPKQKKSDGFTAGTPLSITSPPQPTRLISLKSKQNKKVN